MFHMTYDCFTYNGEKTMLEIRMAILDKHVDHFVICESRQTFSGKPKPIYYTGDNPKVIHVVSPNMLTADSFARAAYQKDYLRTTLATHIAEDNDLVYFGDVDEIWKPQDITDDEVHSLQQLNYCYFLNNRSSEEWVGTIVGRWKTIKTDTLNHWRASHDAIFKDGGWHFTNMGGPEMIRRKLESYDHQEFNNELVKGDLEFKIENDEDYVGREVDWQGKPFEFHVDESELPQYLLDNKEKYHAYFK